LDNHEHIQNWIIELDKISDGRKLKNILQRSQKEVDIQEDLEKDGKIM
jgi:hypothetical protein